MNGYERLKQLYLKEENKDNTLTTIMKYLIKLPNMNIAFSNAEKDIKGLMNYICKKAQEKSVNNIAVIEDNFVFQWAKEYFTETNENLGLSSNGTEKDSKKQLSLELKD